MFNATEVQLQMMFSYKMFTFYEANTVLYMCGAPERLTAFAAYSVITTIMYHKVQLLKPLHLRD
jgi:hypothetical protein